MTTELQGERDQKGHVVQGPDRAKGSRHPAVTTDRQWRTDWPSVKQIRCGRSTGEPRDAAVQQGAGDLPEV